jgi:hypothetical protein
VSITIELELHSLSAAKSGSVTGCIYIDIEGYFFPQRHWDDFVVVLMSWWGEALRKIEVVSSCDFEIDFMEGAYLVNLVKSAGSEEVQFYAVDESCGRTVVASGQESLIRFRNSFLIAAKRLIARCNELHFSSRDLDNLRMQVSRIESINRH